MYQSTTFWYPTLLASRQLTPLAYLLALNAGGVIGSVALGALSEKGGGRRGSATIGVVIALASIPWYLDAASSAALLAARGRWASSAPARGAWSRATSRNASPPRRAASAPASPTTPASASGSYGPYLIGRLQDGGMDAERGDGDRASSPPASWCVVLLWLGPETRGRTLDA